MLQQCDSDQYDNAPSINKSSIYKSSSCEPSIYEPSIYEQPGDEYDENNQRAHKQDSHLQTQVERSAIEMQIRQTDPTIFCDRVAKPLMKSGKVNIRKPFYRARYRCQIILIYSQATNVGA